MQGQLLGKDLSCTVSTECAVTGHEIVFEIESDLRHRVRTATRQPLLFIPMIDLEDMNAPSIVDDF